MMQRLRWMEINPPGWGMSLVSISATVAVLRHPPPPLSSRYTSSERWEGVRTLVSRRVETHESSVRGVLAIRLFFCLRLMVVVSSLRRSHRRAPVPNLHPFRGQQPAWPYLVRPWSCFCVCALFCWPLMSAMLMSRGADVSVRGGRVLCPCCHCE